MNKANLRNFSKLQVKHRTLSYNDIAPHQKSDSDHHRDHLSVTSREALALILPYVQVRITEQLKAVVPSQHI